MTRPIQNVVFAPNKHKATIDLLTRELLIDPKFWGGISRWAKYWVLQHEQAHLELLTENEFLCDQFAFNQVKKANPKANVYMLASEVLSQSKPQERERLNHLQKLEKQAMKKALQRHQNLEGLTVGMGEHVPNPADYLPEDEVGEVFEPIREPDAELPKEEAPKAAPKQVKKPKWLPWVIVAAIAVVIYFIFWRKK